MYIFGGMNRSLQSNWLFDRNVDLGFLFLPVWAVWVVLFLLPDSILQASVPLWVWVVFILGIDVSHVWSTLFRTYTDKEEFQNHKKLLLWGPPLLLAVLFGLALTGPFWFWRILAYLALYHFIKQQYGFLMLYKARQQDHGDRRRISDKFVIYLSMGWPVLYWHLMPGRHFSWFVTGDFLPIGAWWSGLFPHWPAESITLVINILYWGILVAWTAEELWRSHKAGRPTPWGKMLWMLSTAANWYLGIVYFNSDLAFTLTNVVAHGIPYFTLVFFYIERKKQLREKRKPRKAFWVSLSIGAMITAVMLLAMTEEYFWDAWLYGEHTGFFGQLLDYTPAQLAGSPWQAAALALLSLPQVTHYLVDGFIWKSNDKNPWLRPVLLGP